MWNLKFTCMTELFHMCEKISHVIKCMEKSSHKWQKFFTHITKFHMHVKKFTCMWNVDVLNLYFCQHWFHIVPFFHTLFTPFSHDFHTHSPSSARHYEIFMFFFQRRRLLSAYSFSVIHVSVNIKNNIEKLTTFFSSKVQVAMRFSPVAFGLPDLLIELFYIGVHVV